MKDKKKKRRIIWSSLFIICLFMVFGALIGGLVVLNADFTYASFEEYHQTKVEIEILSHLENDEVEEAKSYVIDYLENQYKRHSDPNLGYFLSKIIQDPLVPFYIERAAKTNSDLDARLKKIREEYGVKSYYEQHGVK